MTENEKYVKLLGHQKYNIIERIEKAPVEKEGENIYDSKILLVSEILQFFEV